MSTYLVKTKLSSAKTAKNVVTLLSLLRSALLDPGRGSANFAVFAGSLLSIFNSVTYLTKDSDEQSMIDRYQY